MRAHASIFSANKYFQIKVLNPYRVFVDRYERDSVVKSGVKEAFCLLAPTMIGGFIQMTENNARIIPTINAVDNFNPADFTRQLPNEDGTMSLYLDVKYRLLWFRLHRPNGKIDSEIIHVDDKSAVVCCKLYADRGDALDQYVAKSSAQRFVTQERFGDRYLETAETAAMGRVLAAAGYGTQFCGAADMFGDIMVDAPVDLGAVEEDCSEEPGVASQVKHETKQTGTAQTAATVSMPQPAPATAPAPAAAPKKQEPVTLEDYLNSMTLEEAKNVRIDVGYYKGNTLGELALRKPSDLEWYVKNYSGRNLALKAGAILLVDAASKMAS